MTLGNYLSINRIKLESKKRIRWVSLFLYLFGITVLIGLGVYNQPYYPISWMDEGFVLQGAMNLVQFGEYAMLSSEGFRVLDQPLVANGPGIVLPVAAAFSLFGAGYLQARLTTVIYMLVAAIAFFILTRRLFGTLAAFLSTLTLLAIPREGFLFFGRMALGNVPALTYLYVGYLAWLNFTEYKRSRYAIAAGLLFGLSIITKAQSFILIIAFLIVALLDHFYYRLIGLKKFAAIISISIACFALWYLAQFVIVGKENFSQHLEAIQSSSRVTVFVFSPERIPRNLWYLIYSGAPIFIASSLVYTTWLCRKRDLTSLRLLPLVNYVVVWFGWYAIASIGWHRYAFDAYAVGALFSGKFLLDTARYLSRNERTLDPVGRFIKVAAVVLIVTILCGLTWNSIGQVKQILSRPDTTLQRFATYLEKNIGPHAVIESWEWSIDPLVRLTFHHPTNDWVDKMTLMLTFGVMPEATYDFSDYQPDYLIDGPFSKGAQLYASKLSQGCCKLIFSEPPYDLYQVNEQPTSH